MVLNLRKWFRKSKKGVGSQKNVESADVVMSELAESLRGEIQGLAVEIKRLKMEREGLFRDIHDLMLSKCQESPLFEENPPLHSLPLLHRKRSAQTLWLPILSTVPVPEDDASQKVEMGLFGPRSRTPSVIDSPRPASSADQGGSSPGTNGSASASQLPLPSPARQRPLRPSSETSQSSHNSDAPTTPTRTAWRVVEKKPTSVYLARPGAVAS